MSQFIKESNQAEVSDKQVEANFVPIACSCCAEDVTYKCCGKLLIDEMDRDGI